MKTYPPIQTAIVLALGLCATMATSPPLTNPLILTAETQATISDDSSAHITIEATEDVWTRAQYFDLEVQMDTGSLSGLGRTVRIIHDNPNRAIEEHAFDVDNPFLVFAMLGDCQPQQACTTGLTIEYVDVPDSTTQAGLTVTAELALPEGTATPPIGSIRIRVD